ncbi:hypothetical protein AB0958_21980 [Streptomyces sp. NPDC006655]|uniref:hypothetical protein n=1 Tax=Streptomyces sp. NPDC006655 TaxID=3156898 RepID=UPI0034520268
MVDHGEEWDSHGYGRYTYGVRFDNGKKHCSEWEIEAMAKGRETVVIHPDGTQSTRRSETKIYTHAVESKQDLWASARIQHAQAKAVRAQKAKFIEAVKGGKVVRKSSPVANYSKRSDVYLLHADGERFWLGSEYGASETGPLDLKVEIRRVLADYDKRAETHERDARTAESGPRYRYGVWRWSQNEVNATKAASEFAKNHTRGTTTYRVVPVEAAE